MDNLSTCDPLPILEILEKHLQWMGKQRQLYQAYKGTTAILRARTYLHMIPNIYHAFKRSMFMSSFPLLTRHNNHL